MFLLPCGTKIFADVYFWGLAIDAIFCILQELIFAFRTDFCKRKKESPGQIIDNIFVRFFFWVRAMEIHILKQHYVLRTLCKTNKIGYFSLSFDYKNEQTRLPYLYCIFV